MRLRKLTVLSSFVALALFLGLPLSGLGGAAHAAGLTAAPPSIVFPKTGVGAQSADVTVTYSNGGNVAVTVATLTTTGMNASDFLITSMNMIMPPFKIGPGATVQVTVAFVPMGGGNRVGALSAGLSGGGTVDVPLSGVGLGPTIQVTPNPIITGGTKINVASQTMVTVANIGGGVVNVKSLVISGPDAASFTLSGVPQLPTPLGAAQNFVATLTFTPMRQGAFSATLTATSDDPNTPSLVVPLKGQAGDPQVAVDVGTVAFGNIRLLLSSQPQTINISNSGNSDLHVAGITVGGMNAADYALSLGGVMLPTTLKIGQMLPITVSYKPAQLGTSKGTIIIASDDPNSPNKSIFLFGNGTQAILALAANSGVIDFKDQQLYQSSMPQNITINNTGNDAAYVTGASFGLGMNSAFRISPTVMYPVKIPAGGSAVIPISAVPLVLALSTDTLTIALDDKTTQSLAVVAKVNGVGSSITVTPAYLDFGVVGVLSKVTLTTTVANIGTSALHITMPTMNDAMGVFTTDLPMMDFMLDAGKSQKISVTFAPTVEGPAEGMGMPADIEIQTDDPMAKFVHIPIDGIGAVANIQVQPAMGLVFGTTLVNNPSAPQNVTIANMGGVAVNIISVLPGGANAAQFQAQFPDMTVPPFMLGPGKMKTVSVTYSPLASGTHNATLVVSPMGFMPIQLKLTGNAVQPQLQVGLGQSPHPFGGSPISIPTDPFTFNLKNSGNVAVTIMSITSNDPNFIVDSSMTTLNLAMNGLTGFNVLFNPMSAGSKSGIISVTIANYAQNPIVTVMVSGTGTQGACTSNCGGGDGGPVGNPNPGRGGNCSVSLSRTSSNGGGPLGTLGLFLVLAALFARRRRSV